MAQIIAYLSLLALCSGKILPIEIPEVVIENSLIITGVEMTTLKNRNFFAFRGIPYAEPPTGKLRFKAPVRKHWATNNTFNASKDGPECAQFGLDKSIVGQEDCLTLNVYTTNISLPLRKVMVYIHGGSFIAGSDIYYFPGRILDRDVVIVTLNYRLGPLSLLSTLDDASPGNYGLLDQTEALRWVQRNIDAFGGNPNKVTLFGHGSGSVSVFSHFISPISKGLFHRASAQSGNPVCPWAEQANPKYRANLLAAELACSNTTAEKLVECLREKPVEEFAEATRTILNAFILTLFGLVADRYFHADLPSKLLKNGQIANKSVPLMTGTTKDEGLIFLPNLMIHKKETSSPTDLLLNVTSLSLNIERKSVKKKTVDLIWAQYFNNSEEIDSEVLSDAMYVGTHFDEFQTLGQRSNIEEMDFEVLSDAMFIAPHFEGGSSISSTWVYAVYLLI